jgi:hypothetical protein
MENDETFMRITNKDIYQKLVDVENHVKATNGKVKLNRWIATTALTMCVSTLLVVVKIIN